MHVVLDRSSFSLNVVFFVLNDPLIRRYKQSEDEISFSFFRNYVKIYIIFF